MKSLVIVESPAKAKTIEKYLGKDYKVKASIGHVKDLPKSKLGVDMENDFLPTYEIIKDKKKIIDELRSAAESAEKIFLALDPDREGEAIAWHVAQEIIREEAPKKKSKASAAGTKKSKSKKEKETPVSDVADGSPTPKKPVYRVLFNEITKKAIQEAILHPIELNKNLYEAQQARRVLDRIVGYQVSPLLWDKVRRGLSAGRVQTVALRIICERERAIKAFVPEEYWSLEALLEGSIPPSFRAKLSTHKGKKLKVENGEESARIVSELKNVPHILKSITKKERKRHPHPPFITSRLQQEASQKLGFSAARTMAVAQQLYEGIDLGEGPVGLITYMRTDSTRLSDDAIREARQLISQRWGIDYLPDGPVFYKNKKSAQDAHEAIRPTSAVTTPEQVKGLLESDQFRLYELIWKRFVACQMSSAVYDQVSFDIGAGDYGYRANGSQVKFPGFLAAYEMAVEDNMNAEKANQETSSAEEETTEGLLPLLQEGETLRIHELKPEQHFTQPPPKFNDASLIRELEENGIGRPSTYAAILSNIVDKEYVRKELKTYTPTELGLMVNDILIASFPNIFNVEFTAKMEGELDNVEEGTQTYSKALGDFYAPFRETLEKAKVEMKDIKRLEISTDFTCEKCQHSMVIKWGRRGEFLACSNYPDCRSTREFKRLEDGTLQLVAPETTDEVCPKCGAPMLIKSGRFGKFLACSKYPECKSTKAISLGINCPNCGGPLAERRSKKGRNFYGCTKYPDCKFATWDKPIKEPCPQCGSPCLVEKKTKTSSTVKCPKEGCEYTREG